MFENKNYIKESLHIESKCLKHAKLSSSPELSIIIPAYKQKNILMEAIESAVDQITAVNYEIIIVDNDNDESEIQFLKQKLQNERYWRVSYYVNEQNLGMCGNHNRGALLAKGKYLTYLHTDDILCQDYVELLWNYLSLHPQIEVLYFKYSPLKMGNILPVPAQMAFIRKRDKGLDPKRIVRVRAFDVIPYKIQVAPCETIMMRNLFLSMGGYNPNCALLFDMEFAMRCILQKRLVCWLDYTLFIKRFGENTSHDKKKEMIQDLLELLMAFCKHTHYPYQNNMVYYRILKLCKGWQGHHSARQMGIHIPSHMGKHSTIKRCNTIWRLYFEWFWYLHAVDQKGLTITKKRA